jgi:drug/metabolite transporter (DMT)-like permease
MKALTLADISALEPINFTRLVWGALLGFLFFDEVPTIWVWVGGLIIVASTSYIARREAILRTDIFKVPDTPT